MADGRVVIDTLLNSRGAENGIKNLGRTLSNSLGKISALLATAFSVGALVNFGKQAIELASDISEVQNVVDTAFGDMAYKMEEFANKSIDMYGISKLTAKRTASTYMSMARALGLSMEEASDMSLALTGLSADMASFYNVSQEVADTALKSVFTGETETLKTYGIVMTQTNLQEFAYRQGINKKIQAMTQAEQVQLRYAYVLEQTALAQGDFAKTSDSWANQTRILQERWKEFLSIVGNGLVQVLTPTLKMLNNIMSSLIAIATNLANMFGFTTEVAQSNAGNIASTMEDVADATNDAVDATNNQSDALKDEADSAKKANKAMSGLIGKYDELTVISSQAESASGGDKAGKDDISDALSGLTGAIGTGATIEASKVGTDAGNSMADMIKRAFESYNFTEIGNTIGTKIKNALDNIPWKDIQESCKHIVQSIGTFINGFVDSDIFSSFGSTLAQALNTVLVGADTFFTTVNWENLGKALTRSVQTFFTTIDWKLVGKTIIDFAIAQIDFIAGLIRGIDWKALPKDIVTAIEGVLSGANWKGIIFSVADLGVAIFDSLQNFIRGLTGDNAILTGLADAILIAILALKFSGFALTGFATSIQAVLAPIASEIFVGLGASLAAAFAGFSLGKWIGEKLLSDENKQYYDPEWNPFEYSLKDWKEGLEAWWNDGIVPWWKDKFTKLGELLSKLTQPIKEGWESIKDKTVTLTAEAKEKVNGALAKIKAGWEVIKDKTASLYAEAKEKVNGGLAKIKESWDSIKDKTVQFIATIPQKWADLKEHWNGLTKNIQNKVVEFKGHISQRWSDIKDYWNNLTKNIKNKTAQFRANISQKWSDISTKWYNLSNNIKNKVAQFTGSIPQKWSDLKSKWTSITSNIKDKVVSFSAKVTTTAQSIKNSFKSIFNNVFTWINKNFIDKLNDMFNITFNGFTNPLTGKKVGATSIKLLNLPHIPQLATGAVLPSNSPFLAMVGDQKHGTNIEAPLDTIVDAFRTAMNEFGVNVTFEVQGDPEKIFKVVQKKDADNYRRTGRPSFNV